MAAEREAAEAGAGLFASLKSLVATLLATGRLRLSLLATELEEEKLRLVDILISALAGIFLLSLGLILLLFFVALAFWEQRLLVFGLAAAITLGLGGFFVARLLLAVSRPTALFRASLKELDKDIETLNSSAERQ